MRIVRKKHGLKSFFRTFSAILFLPVAGRLVQLGDQLLL